MGCDIHPVVQRRVGDKWETVPTPPDLLDEYGDPPWATRNYVTFGILAGVRDDYLQEIAEPRGLPPDIPSTFERLKAEGKAWAALDSRESVDGYDLGEHSFSWVTLRELAGFDFEQPHPNNDGGRVGDVTGIQGWLPYLASLGAPDDVRLVFGFDS